MRMRGKLNIGCPFCGGPAGPDCADRKGMTRTREKAQWRREEAAFGPVQHLFRPEKE